MSDFIDFNEALETVVPLKVVEEDILRHCYRRPSAIMLPVSWHPNYTAIYGYPIYRGDRYALIYEAP